jgi:hypothetical protein
MSTEETNRLGAGAMLRESANRLDWVTDCLDSSHPGLNEKQSETVERLTTDLTRIQMDLTELLKLFNS